MKQPRERALAKIACIIALADTGLKTTDIRKAYNATNPDAPISQDYVTETVKAWIKTGKSNDPDAVRIAKGEIHHKAIEKPKSADAFEAVNRKLDRILEILEQLI